ncbi:peptidyl-prolyl cis-trans isomerase, putative [Ixodes scapularis]|uniref:Spliceosome-associated protein CWC27 homolog n=1 Tax=Ixodes scapularis TaxID=6945 RepID=B7Q0Z9_IXOSC|nr:peptidyl-prolyl cis-trans isomerase, putative [Ixodes scapularis]|eukprot:XP_002408668.1 peptidyl-prolyl cis-trans isomerase, putative [Ixodes scapularis]
MGPPQDEFHTRLQFVRRGLVAMASGGADDNGSQFFFTLGATPDLHNRHTVFGKVAGSTLYNMLWLEDGLVDSNDRPLHPHKIVSTEVGAVNPFEDLVAREKERVRVADEECAAKEKLKNYKLLSFGEEAEEDEMELDAGSKDQKGKSKSSHDLTDDPGLSSVPVVDPEYSTAASDDDEETTGAVATATAVAAARVRQKFKDGVTVTSKLKRLKKDDEEEEVRNYFEDEQRKASIKKIGEIRKEFRQLKQEMRAQDEARQEKAAKGDEQVDENSETEEERRNALFKACRDEQRLYAKKKKQLKKGSQREQQAGRRWDLRRLAHTLHFEEQGPVLARDAASLNPEEAYDISDPSNTMNQRRRDRRRKSHHSERRH